jgi:hypothetical protein
VGHDNRLDAKLAVRMAPEVVAGARPDTGLRPLPPLERFYPRTSGLNLQLSVELDYADLGRVMTGQLADETVDIGGHRARVDALELGGQGQEIRIDVKLSGPAAGVVALRADLVFSSQTQQFGLENLDYTYRAEDPLIEADANFLRGHIRTLLTDTANQQLQQRMHRWQERLQILFNRLTPDDVQLDMTSLQLRQAVLDMTAAAIRLNAHASGDLRLVFRED